MTSSIEQQVAAIQQVVASAQEMADTAKNLKVTLAAFKLDDQRQFEEYQEKEAFDPEKLKKELRAEIENELKRAWKKSIPGTK